MSEDEDEMLTLNVLHEMESDEIKEQINQKVERRMNSESFDGNEMGRCESRCVSCVSCACGVLVLLCLFGWIASVLPPYASQTDSPEFGRSVIWQSIVHHTQKWKEYRFQHLPPPPPPSFI